MKYFLLTMANLLLALIPMVTGITPNYIADYKFYGLTDTTSPIVPLDPSGNPVNTLGNFTWPTVSTSIPEPLAGGVKFTYRNQLNFLQSMTISEGETGQISMWIRFIGGALSTFSQIEYSNTSPTTRYYRISTTHFYGDNPGNLRVNLRAGDQGSTSRTVNQGNLTEGWNLFGIYYGPEKIGMKVYNPAGYNNYDVRDITTGTTWTSQNTQGYIGCKSCSATDTVYMIHSMRVSKDLQLVTGDEVPTPYMITNNFIA